MRYLARAEVFFLLLTIVYMVPWYYSNTIIVETAKQSFLVLRVFWDEHMADETNDEVEWIYSN